MTNKWDIWGSIPAGFLTEEQRQRNGRDVGEASSEQVENIALAGLRK